MQLVGVPGEFEKAVERLDVDQPAEHTTLFGAHLMLVEFLGAAGQDHVGGVGRGRGRSAESVDV
jgi:hypothetical protein